MVDWSRSVAIALVVSILGPAHAAADASAPGDHTKAEMARWHVASSYHGEFDRQASMNENMINAAPIARPARPPLVVSDEKLALLNRARASTIAEVMKELGLHEAPSAVRTVQAVIGFGAVDNGLGGHYGGLDLIVSVNGVAPDKDASGFGFATVGLVDGEKPQLDALRAALRAAMKSALDTFRYVIARPVGNVVLRFLTNGLSPAQRRALAGPPMVCAAQLATPVRIDNLPDEGDALRMRVQFRIGRYDPKETAEAFLKNLASLIESGLRDSVMAPCHLPRELAPLRAISKLAQLPDGGWRIDTTFRGDR